MEAKLTKIDNDHHKIEWSDGEQFGVIDIQWDYNTNKLIFDTELLGTETLVKIIKSINN